MAAITKADRIGLSQFRVQKAFERAGLTTSPRIRAGLAKSFSMGKELTISKAGRKRLGALTRGRRGGPGPTTQPANVGSAVTFGKVPRKKSRLGTLSTSKRVAIKSARANIKAGKKVFGGGPNPRFLSKKGKVKTLFAFDLAKRRGPIKKKIAKAKTRVGKASTRSAKTAGRASTKSIVKRAAAKRAGGGNVRVKSFTKTSKLGKTFKVKGSSRKAPKRR